MPPIEAELKLDILIRKKWEEKRLLGPLSSQFFYNYVDSRIKTLEATQISVPLKMSHKLCLFRHGYQHNASAYGCLFLEIRFSVHSIHTQHICMHI